MPLYTGAQKMAALVRQFEEHLLFPDKKRQRGSGAFSLSDRDVTGAKGYLPEFLPH